MSISSITRRIVQGRTLSSLAVELERLFSPTELLVSMKLVPLFRNTKLCALSAFAHHAQSTLSCDELYYDKRAFSSFLTHVNSAK